MTISLDAYTLLVVGAFTGFVLSFLMQLFSNYFKTYEGFNHLSLSFFLLALALLLQAAGRHWPIHLSLITSAAGLGISCMYWGIHRFRQIRIQYLPLMMCFVAVLAVSPLTFQHMDHGSAYRALMTGAATMAAVALCAWAVYRPGPYRVLRYQRLALSGFVYLELCFVGRLIGIVEVFETAPLHPANLLQAMVVFSIPVIFIVLSTSFMWGCLEINAFEIREQAKRLEENQTFLNVMLDTIPIPVFYKGTDGVYLSVNKSFCKATAMKEDEIIGKTAVDVFHHGETSKSRETDNIVIDTKNPLKYTAKLLYGDGLRHEVLVNKNLYINPDMKPIGIVGTLTDITEGKIHEAKISYMALHDLLTTLPNRNLFFELLEKALASAKRSGSVVALLYLDLDGFKQINDNNGHDAGDYVLQVIARRLQDSVRKSDSVGRLGGDEFGIVVNDMKSKEDIADFAQKIIKALSAPIHHEEQEYTVGVSIGIACAPTDCTGLNQLVKCADTAMYHSKQRGKNTFTFCNQL